MVENATTDTDKGDGAGTNGGRPLKPLRIWPAALLLLAMAGARLFSSRAGESSDTLMMVTMLTPLLASMLMAMWWLLASRASWKERLGGILGLVAAGGLAYALAHETMHSLAPMGLVAIPLGMAAFGLACVCFGRSLTARRTVVAVLVATCAFGYSALLRNEGMWGDAVLSLEWRWSQNSEERILAEATDPAAQAFLPVPPSAVTDLESPEWPGFRGASRSGHQQGTILTTDWNVEPPEELWRIPVGPAWSSFAVAGKLLFTQEQRGAMEVVACYNADSGQAHWITEVESRFSESLGGPGPRATPTLHEGALYALGAQGFLMRLDPMTGEKVWQRDIRETAKREPPTWGFAASPLIVDGAVIVHAGGDDDKGILAYDAATGDDRWSVSSGNHTYSSPHAAEIGGKAVVLMLSNAGLNVLESATGTTRLDYEWKHRDYRVLQPQEVGEGSFLLASGIGAGTRRVTITDADGVLSATEQWAAKDFRPDFNGCVVYERHAYGFDGARFVCFDLETGKRKWRGGRYGKGQVLLLEDGGQLLVTTEKGEIVLLEANAESHVELTRFRAFSGKTWNHPVVVGDRLFARNSEEAVCYRLPSSPLAGGSVAESPAA